MVFRPPSCPWGHGSEYHSDLPARLCCSDCGSDHRLAPGGTGQNTIPTYLRDCAAQIADPTTVLPLGARVGIPFRLTCAAVLLRLRIRPPCCPLGARVGMPFRLTCAAVLLRLRIRPPSFPLATGRITITSINACWRILGRVDGPYAQAAGDYQHKAHAHGALEVDWTSEKSLTFRTVAPTYSDWSFWSGCACSVIMGARDERDDAIVPATAHVMRMIQ